LEQLRCYGSLPSPLRRASPSAPCAREEKGKRKAKPLSPNLVTPTGAEQRKVPRLFFFFFFLPPRTTNHRRPAQERSTDPSTPRPHGKERRAAAAASRGRAGRLSWWWRWEEQGKGNGRGLVVAWWEGGGSVDGCLSSSAHTQWRGRWCWNYGLCPFILFNIVKEFKIYY